MTSFSEDDVEQAALNWLESLGWRTAHGPGIVPHERADYSSVVLETRFRDSNLSFESLNCRSKLGMTPTTSLPVLPALTSSPATENSTGCW